MRGVTKASLRQKQQTTFQHMSRNENVHSFVCIYMYIYTYSSPTHKVNRTISTISNEVSDPNVDPRTNQRDRVEGV